MAFASVGLDSFKLVELCWAITVANVAFREQSHERGFRPCIGERLVLRASLVTMSAKYWPSGRHGFSYIYAYKSNAKTPPRTAVFEVT
jgi:hypothetical protein